MSMDILNNTISVMETAAECCGGFNSNFEKVKFELLKELKEYKVLEEQGLLLKLPCKVGDTVYIVRKYSYCPSGACKMEISCSECRKSAPYEIYKRKFKLDDLMEIGKTIFLNKEEAEATLQEMKEKKK